MLFYLPLFCTGGILIGEKSKGFASHPAPLSPRKSFWTLCLVNGRGTFPSPLCVMKCLSSSRSGTVQVRVIAKGCVVFIRGRYLEDLGGSKVDDDFSRGLCEHKACRIEAPPASGFV